MLTKLDVRATFKIVIADDHPAIPGQRRDQVPVIRSGDEVDGEARLVVLQLGRWRLRNGSCYTAGALSGQP